MKSLMNILVVALATAPLVISTSSAASITKGDATATGTVLNVDAAWTGGVQPASGDVALWNSTSQTAATTYTLGGNLSWAGIATDNSGASLGTGITIGGGGSTLTLGGSGVLHNFSASGNTTALNLNTSIVFSANQTWSGDKSGSTSQIVASGAIDGGGFAWTKAGVAALRVTGNVTNLGSLTIAGGTVSLGTSGAPGLLSSGARLITVSSGATIESWQNGTVTQSTGISPSAISGAGNFSKQGTGTTTLDVANTYTGTTTIGATGGILRAGVATSAFGNNSAVSIGTGSTLDLNGFNNTIGSLTGAGNVTLGLATLTTGGNNTTTSFSGVISGTGGLTKVGTGTQTLTGANTYAGVTLISAGTMATSSTGTFGTGNILVNAGGTLTLGNIASVGDAANVVFDSTLTTGAKINLSYAVSTAETINSLSSISGTSIGPGTYDATALNAAFGNTNVFAGTGSLTILASAIPEPSTYAAIFGAMVLGCVYWRRCSLSAVRKA